MSFSPSRTLEEQIAYLDDYYKVTQKDLDDLEWCTVADVSKVESEIPSLSYQYNIYSVANELRRNGESNIYRGFRDETNKSSSYSYYNLPLEANSKDFKLYQRNIDDTTGLSKIGCDKRCLEFAIEDKSITAPVWSSTIKNKWLKRLPDEPNIIRVFSVTGIEHLEPDQISRIEKTGRLVRTQEQVIRMILKRHPSYQYLRPIKIHIVDHKGVISKQRELFYSIGEDSCSFLFSYNSNEVYSVDYGGGSSVLVNGIPLGAVSTKNWFVPCTYEYDESLDFDNVPCTAHLKDEKSPEQKAILASVLEAYNNYKNKHPFLKHMQGYPNHIKRCLAVIKSLYPDVLRKHEVEQKQHLTYYF